MANATTIQEIRLIVNQALKGDQSAMLNIVERYKQRVFGLCYRMLGQREDAEDVAQEAFLRVLNNLTRWDQSRAFEPWLMTIAANRCRTQLARRRSNAPPQALPFSPSDERWTNESNAQHLLEEIQLALGAIPSKHGRAFSLFHQQQMSYAEIAVELGVPEGTVKTWVHRARNELVRRLTERQVLEKRRAM